MSDARRILEALACGGTGCPCGRWAENGKGQTHCPAHGDANPSLSVSDSDGVLLVHCHARCSQQQVINALDAKGLWPKTTDYRVGVGGMIHRRSETTRGKRMSWHRAGGLSGLGGVHTRDLPLYGIEATDSLADGATVLVAEGEKARNGFASRGLAAVGTVGGAGVTPSDGVLRPLVRFDVVLAPDNDAPGFLHMSSVGRALKSMGPTPRMLELPGLPPKGDVCDWEGEDCELQRLIANAPQWTPSAPSLASVGLTRLSDIEAKAVEWLWNDRIPRAKLALLEGDPGLGKSTIVADLAARLSRGSCMPDGTASCFDGPVNVVFLSGEDGAGDTIKPRILAAGGDASYVTVETPGAEPIWLDDLEPLRALLTAADARLLVIDPLAAYVPGSINMHHDQDIRGLLRPLRAIAEECDCTVLVVRHLNKASGFAAIYRGGGSIGIGAATRSVLLVAKRPDHEGERVLAPVKSNLAREAPALAFTVEDQEGSPVIRWGGPVAISADALVAPPSSDGGERQRAIEFLREELADGPVKSTELVQRAKDEGIKERTLERAKSAAGARSKPRGGVWYWALESTPAVA